MPLITSSALGLDSTTWTDARASSLDAIDTGALLCQPDGLPTICTSNAVAGTWGAWAEIVAGSTITSDFVIVAVFLTGTTGANFWWNLELGTGAGGSETAVGKWSAISWNVNDRSFVSPGFILCSANDRVACRLKSENGNEQARVSFFYKEV